MILLKRKRESLYHENRYTNEQYLLMEQYVVPAKWKIKKELNDTLIEVKCQR